MSHSLPKWRSKESQIKALTDDSTRNSLSLGCGACSLRDVCGGLHVADPLLSCSDLCCGAPKFCSRVCRIFPERYVSLTREVGGFSFDDVPRTSATPHSIKSGIAPLIYHGSGRLIQSNGTLFSVRLADLVNFRTGALRFNSRLDLATHFRIPERATLIVSGVDHDHRIEPWWSLAERRSTIIRGMKSLGVAAVTTPNFSVLLDRPRPDDLHAMKRIAIVFEEFQREGIACALHPNGRTFRDFERWGVFISERSEVALLAYEFITGPRRKARVQFHLDQLSSIAEKCSRPLDIIVRGDPEIIPILRQSFRHVIYIETTSFLKTVQRQRAIRMSNAGLSWRSHTLSPETALDELLAHNQSEHLEYLHAMYFGMEPKLPTAA